MKYVRKNILRHDITWYKQGLLLTSCCTFSSNVTLQSVLFFLPHLTTVTVSVLSIYYYNDMELYGLKIHLII